MHEPHARIRHKTVRPGRTQRRVLYAATLALLLSGITWLLAHYALPLPEDAARHPLEPWAMRIHGAATFFGMATLGALWANHVLPAWRQGQRRSTGLPVLATWMLLALSGYGLYYLADEDWRGICSNSHIAVGLALPLLLAAHIVVKAGNGKKDSWQITPASAQRRQQDAD